MEGRTGYYFVSSVFELELILILAILEVTAIEPNHLPLAILNPNPQNPPLSLHNQTIRKNQQISTSKNPKTPNFLQLLQPIPIQRQPRIRHPNNLASIGLVVGVIFVGNFVKLDHGVFLEFLED